jgi:hypothetical protein
VITGTILCAIALSQLAGPALHPPKWSWISFLGITIPGMLVLVGREAVKEATERWEQGPALTRWLRMLATESLLIVGLTVMVYGSYTNLNLGVNGYTVAPKGNAAGLTLWVAAALFLIGVRGAFKLAASQGSDSAGHRLLSRLLYILGAIALIYGERAVVTGKAPQLVVGGAAPVALIFLFGGILMLLLGGVAAQTAIASVRVAGGQAAGASA